jgi:hypothetical protein
MVCHFTGVQSKGIFFKGLCCQLCGGITFNMGVLLIPSFNMGVLLIRFLSEITLIEWLLCHQTSRSNISIVKQLSANCYPRYKF